MICNPNITEYIGKAANEQVVVLEKIRQLVHSSVKNVEEEIKWGFPVFNNGKDFAYLRFAKKHITLGFYNINKLKDPNSLLEGQGNTLKHIKLKELNNELEEQIVKWLNQITYL